MQFASFSLKKVTAKNAGEQYFSRHGRTTSSSLQNYKKKLNPQK